MNVFNSRPNTWRDLQDFVGQLFKEIGYQVEVSTVIDLVRGKKEIDVYVQDTESEYNTTFLIECKFWNKPVNQDTVHAFNTVIHDAGANFGFIVSRHGFQSGCYEAATKTNIKLVSLEELERKFYNKWQLGMAKKYMPMADRLFPYWDYPGKQAKRVPLDWNTKLLLNEAYNPFIQLGPFSLRKFHRTYPQIVPLLDDSFEIIDRITLNNDRDYFDFLENKKDESLRHYQIFYGEI